MIAGQSLREARAFVELSGAFDAGERDVFDEDMGCFQDQPANIVTICTRIDQRERSAITVTDEDGCWIFMLLSTSGNAVSASSRR